MKRHSRRLRLGQVFLFAVLLASGASAQTPSGFLSDYSRLSPAADLPGTSIWISKDFDFKPYRKIMLDKVEVFVSPTSEKRFTLATSLSTSRVLTCSAFGQRCRASTS